MKVFYIFETHKIKNIIKSNIKTIFKNIIYIININFPNLNKLN
jgi:hypothetical protein